MKTNFRLPVTAALGAVIALAFSSCEYDPYYSGGSYGYGYGDGYGYGNSNFSTSLFINTGNPRWGYDPHTYCYYDYHSRRYYDPYLYGYYPVGYRPVVVVGAPHPHGWRPGQGHCPPPTRVREVTVVNYRDRESAYRNSNYSWAKQVRPQPSHYASHDSYPSRGSSYGGSSHSYNRSSNYPNYSKPQPYSRPSYSNPLTPNRDRDYQPQRSEPDRHKTQSNTLLSRYAIPREATPSRPSYTAPERSNSRSAPSYQQRSHESHDNNRRSPYSTPSGGSSERSNKSDSDDKNKHGRFRSLGDG